MEHERRALLESINKESAEVERHLFRVLKLLPLVALYSMYVSGIYKSEGPLSALLAWSWIIFLACGWPKGFIKQMGMAVVFGIILPIILVPYFGH